MFLDISQFICSQIHHGKSALAGVHYQPAPRDEFDVRRGAEEEGASLL